MKYIKDSNDKLTMVVEYSNAFQSADLYPHDIQSMKDRANSILRDEFASPRENTLAAQMLRAVLWIEREVWINQKTCDAIGCEVKTKRFMCGSHYMLLPKEIRKDIKVSKYCGSSCISAIEYIAVKENKEITSTQYMSLKRRFG